MNLCFLLGKVISDVEFKFIYNSKNISIIFFDIILNNKSVIRCKAYDEIADWIYRNIKKSDIVLIKGILKSESIEIDEIVRN